MEREGDKKADNGRLFKFFLVLGKRAIASPIQQIHFGLLCLMEISMQWHTYAMAAVVL